jgi:hypothetical protein
MRFPLRAVFVVLEDLLTQCEVRDTFLFGSYHSNLSLNPARPTCAGEQTQVLLSLTEFTRVKSLTRRMEIRTSPPGAPLFGTATYPALTQSESAQSLYS